MAAKRVRHRGSLLAGKHELRITQRCRDEDLGITGTDFADAEGHPIVKAFIERRSSNPTGGKTVGPEAGSKTLYRLGTTHDHRGATWYDPDERVVWLCAYGLHRSRTPQDAFKHFSTLLKESRIRPTVDDYEALFADRAHRFAERLPEDARTLLETARETPGTEVTDSLGGEDQVNLYVERLESLEETFVAFDASKMDPMRPPVLLAALYPDAAFNEWDLVTRLPTRALDKGEVCYRILRG